MRIHALVWFFIATISRFANGDEDTDIELKPALSECKRINPCGATLFAYPLLEDEHDFSGYGSGMAPVYDEILTHDIYDLNGTPEQKNFTLCQCPNDERCDFSNEENSMKVDYHVTLRFCDKSQLSSVCRKNNANLRVIGNAQLTGDPTHANLDDVTKSMIFCNCPLGFSRQGVEVWAGSEISLNYKCL
ncbi:unnamed protein product [Caenorhabditis bovis]|uniref:DUF281 domain-containing protein n=1 Tax=Caenorhabditis bovis TaxID=2654633 RepID=A0A8S1F090_9PELO|nr:unnamed protein product [Caenorhabditis bovis]